ncbi:ABC transporter permease [Aliidiomarina minuta]|uniref:ABC transporter permease n=1 Tax=Aliidiomarina minuta TaxID=880057 RepID=A0A432W763_9GAMM|nr:ABC transporter permease subunit [Aliidiomarina minuta]RUO25796.1 ABC transporter permease [Aliidiomarina minuta]
MSRYVLRQLSLLLVTFFLLTLLSFSLGYWFPGDALANLSGIQTLDSALYEQAIASRSFDQNIAAQYFSYLTHLLQGDWGVSLQDGEPVWNEMKIRFPATMELALLALLLALAIGLPAGIISAVYYTRWPDRVINTFSLSGYSIPVFWLAQLLILIFAVTLGLIPIAGQINPLYNIEPVTGSILIDIMISDGPHRLEALGNALRHMVLPVIVLAIMPATLLTRITRSALHDVLNKNYIHAARAKGLHSASVIWKHAVPNAMQNITRQLGLLFSILITNTMITEVIFSWPGVGSWLVRSIYERDYPVMQAGLLVLATLILLVNVLLSLLHAWRYPQVRQELYATH